MIHISILILTRIFVTLLVRTRGFFSLSDDDFSRMVLAQTFAVEPRLDPTGSSWLPLPFWVSGALMKMTATTVDSAMMISVAIACLCGPVLYGAARYSGVSSWAGFGGTMLWTLMPVSVFVGAGFVPELPTATLCACAVLLLEKNTSKAFVLAGICVCLASLCRYEAWIVAACMTIPIGIAVCKQRDLRDRIISAISIALCGLGPSLWILWNYLAYGNALRFHQRVSSYWFCQSPNNDLIQLLLVYAKPLLLDAPLWTVGIVLACVWTTFQHALNRKRHLAIARIDSGSSLLLFSRWTTTIMISVGVVVTLTALLVSGGAPTHHPERTVLLVWAVGWIAELNVFCSQAAALSSQAERLRRISVWVITLVVGFVQLIRTCTMASDYGINRVNELQLGMWLRNHTSANVLLASTDYSYFAVQAAMGPQPSKRFLQVDCTADCRNSSPSCSFDNESSIRQRITRDNIQWLVASDPHVQVAKRIGNLKATVGKWSIIKVTEN